LRIKNDLVFLLRQRGRKLTCSVKKLTQLGEARRTIPVQRESRTIAGRDAMIGPRRLTVILIHKEMSSTQFLA